MNKTYINIKDLPAQSILPPQNLELEEAVLSAMIIEQNAYNEVSNLLNIDCFYSDKNKIIFNAIQQLRIKLEPIDMLTLINQLKKTNELELIGGISYIAELSNKVSTSSNIISHSLLIYEEYLRRQIIKICTEQIRFAYDKSQDIFNLINSLLSQGLDLMKIKTDKVTTLSKELLLLNKHIENNKTFEIQTTGYLTGIYCLDKHTGGLQPSDLIIIAGETSHGKTSIATQLALGACKTTDVKAVIYSLEMSNQQLTARFLANETGIDYKTILFSKINESDNTLIHTGINSLNPIQIFFDAGANSDILSICNSIHAIKIKYNINIIIVDYLQLVSTKNSRLKTDEQIAEVCKMLKSTAKELNICIVLISQFSREESRTHKYTLASLKGSSGIEQAADLVLFIQRPEIYGAAYFDYPFSNIDTKEKVIISIEKGRNYGLTKFLLKFNPLINKFENWHDEEVKEINSANWNND